MVPLPLPHTPQTVREAEKFKNDCRCWTAGMPVQVDLKFSLIDAEAVHASSLRVTDSLDHGRKGSACILRVEAKGEPGISRPQLRVTDHVTW